MQNVELGQHDGIFPLINIALILSIFYLSESKKVKETSIWFEQDESNIVMAQEL